MGYFEFDILPIVKNKRSATTAITIKDQGLSRMPTEDRSCRLLSALATGPNLMIIPFSNLTTAGGRAVRIAGPQNVSKFRELTPLRGAAIPV